MNESFARRWLDLFNQSFVTEKDHLSALDRAAGDGDFAVNLGQALKRARTNVGNLAANASTADVFMAAANGFLHTGGTSGPLLGMWLRDLAKAWDTQADPVAGLAAGVKAGTETVQRLGGARAGDRTMVDAMLPALEALDQAVTDHSNLTSALASAARAARQGAAATAHMKAALGRASYVGTAAAGIVDPGAAAMALFFESGAKACSPSFDQP